MRSRPIALMARRLFLACTVIFVGIVSAAAMGTGDANSYRGILQSTVDAKSVAFSVDVWTDTGGQGMSVTGGTYGPDEEVTVYVSATWDCLASVHVGLLSGEIYAMMDANLAAGETVRLPSISLQDLDAPEGAWIVEVNAIAGDIIASDSVRFDVVRGAGPSARLAVDVMTDQGGRGEGVGGGTYTLGTQTILTIELNMDADITLVLEGPGVSTSDEGHLEAGAHTIEMGVAEEGDEGIWTIDVTASADGQQASDSVQFSVVSNDSWGAVALTPTSATTLDALIALKMSLGRLDADPVFDVDRDGSITAADAELILLWSVSAPGA